MHAYTTHPFNLVVKRDILSANTGTTAAPRPAAAACMRQDEACCHECGIWQAEASAQLHTHSGQQRHRHWIKKHSKKHELLTLFDIDLNPNSTHKKYQKKSKKQLPTHPRGRQQPPTAALRRRF